ncbi:MAG: glycosyltransferase [Thermoanaerobaculia bacterium]|jgi:glycosyltransferase involved in cell wall biosynthesis
MTEREISRPSVSIIVPTYNRDKFLVDALESVLRNQLTHALEIIVVDDASSDNTASVLEQYGTAIRTKRLNRNGGAAEARNEGLKLATGKYVKFLDSDDVLCSDTLQDEIQQANDSAADMLLSGWGTVKLDDNNRPIMGSERTFEPPEMVPMPESVLEGKAVPTSAVLYRRSYIEGLRWSSAVRHPDDWYFFCLAALRGGKIVRRDRVSYWLRDHHGTRASSESMLSYARSHHVVLRAIEAVLEQQNLNTPSRRKMLAQYFYKQIYVLALYAPREFERAADHILLLDPGFCPVTFEGKMYMRLFARILGFRRAVLIYSKVKLALFPGRCR